MQTREPKGTAFWETGRFPELSSLAQRQHGVLSRAQLRDLGVSRHRVRHEIEVGRWIWVAPTVIAMQNAPLVRDQLLWLAVLHAGPGSALTHATACERAGLTWTSADEVHVLTRKGDLVSPLEGVRFHQTRRPFERWVHPSADPPRLQVEHAALLTAERDRYLRRAIGLLAATVQQRLTTAERLLSASHDIRKLRHGAHFRLALGDIAGGAQSFAEIDIGRLCREAGLRPPDRQSVRRDAQGRRRYLDCEWILPDGRVIVLEIDGSFHMRTQHWWKDMKRERSVVVSGRTVLRCSSVEIRLEPADIMTDLVAVGVPRLQPRFVCGRSA
jgi:hypothetical protein